MPRCFVIQPFDGGPFDKRFDEVLSPAIVSAKLEPYRVDRDPSVVIPVSAIESGIRDSAACLADITTNNPNVWFELGYALACGKPLILICSSAREAKFPFDVQHRHIIVYKTESTSDFDELRDEVGTRLAAALAREESVQALAGAALVTTEGLDSHEIAALVIIAEGDLDVDSAPSAHSVKNDMGRAGFTEIAAVLAVKALLAAGLIERIECPGAFNQDSYLGFSLTQVGTGWLMQNRNRLQLQLAQPRVRVVNDDDDLPF